MILLLPRFEYRSCAFCRAKMSCISARTLPPATVLADKNKNEDRHHRADDDPPSWCISVYFRGCRFWSGFGWRRNKKHGFEAAFRTGNCLAGLIVRKLNLAIAKLAAAFNFRAHNFSSSGKFKRVVFSSPRRILPVTKFLAV